MQKSAANLKRFKDKTLELKLDIIENFIDHYTSDEKERETLKQTAIDYVAEDHVNEIAQTYPKKETRVYVVNVDDIESDKGYIELTNEEFITEVEKNGQVFSLQGFVRAFNDGSYFSTDTHVIRILTV